MANTENSVVYSEISMKDFVELRKKIIDTTLACNKSNFDYSFIQTEKMFWEQLSKVSNSVVVVMDIHKDKPLFISQTIFNSLGSTASLFSENISEALNKYIHPSDLQSLIERKFYNLCFLFDVPILHKYDYKEIYQYRIKSADRYIWVIEQQQVLHLDEYNNTRITLSIIDISPNQREDNKFASDILNYKTGEILSLDKIPPITILLTERETEILKMIQNGFLSKEISDKLSISFHTVNTHRQNILKKLNANNSLEAINYAKKLGLLS